MAKQDLWNDAEKKELVGKDTNYPTYHSVTVAKLEKLLAEADSNDKQPTKDKTPEKSTNDTPETKQDIPAGDLPESRKLSAKEIEQARLELKDPNPTSENPPKSEDPPTPPPSDPDTITKIEPQHIIAMVKDGIDTKRAFTKAFQEVGLNYDADQFDELLLKLSGVQAIIRYKDGNRYKYIPRPKDPLCAHCGVAMCRTIRLRRRAFPQQCAQLKFIE